jgi:hypothetical protein
MITEMSLMPWKKVGFAIYSGRQPIFVPAIQVETTEKGYANAKAVELAINNTYGKSINPEVIPELLSALENILLDAEPLKDQYQVAIPSVSISLIKAVIEKAKR